jgi:hypothetical protein
MDLLLCRPLLAASLAERSAAAACSRAQQVDSKLWHSVQQAIVSRQANAWSHHA